MSPGGGIGGPTRRAFLAGTGAALVAARAAHAGDEAVYSNARILTGVMPGGDTVTELRGGLRIRDGKVVEMGPGVTGGTDLAGAVVWPGTWEAGTTLGIAEIDLEAGTRDDSEAGEPLQPQVRVVDAYNPGSALLPVVRARGVMGALVTPGGGIVSGQAAWMRTDGEDVAGATVMAPAGIVVNLGRAGVNEKGASSRMGVAARLRDVLDANPPPKEPPKPTAWKRAPPVDPNKKPPTRAEKAWHDLQLRKLKAIFVAERASDIALALGLAEEYGLDAVLLGASEGWKLSADLAQAGVPVIVGPVTVQPDNFDHLGARYDNAALLHEAGVRIGLRIGDAHRAFDLTTEAGIAVANGLPWEVAIAAVTGNSPGFFGLANGRLWVGGEASFVVSDGDPLEPRTAVRRRVVRGVELPLTSRQSDLYERFEVLK